MSARRDPAAIAGDIARQIVRLRSDLGRVATYQELGDAYVNAVEGEEPPEVLGCILHAMKPPLSGNAKSVDRILWRAAAKRLSVPALRELYDCGTEHRQVFGELAPELAARRNEPGAARFVRTLLLEGMWDAWPVTRAGLEAAAAIVGDATTAAWIETVRAESMDPDDDAAFAKAAWLPVPLQPHADAIAASLAESARAYPDVYDLSAGYCAQLAVALLNCARGGADVLDPLRSIAPFLYGDQSWVARHAKQLVRKATKAGPQYRAAAVACLQEGAAAVYAGPSRAGALTKPAVRGRRAGVAPAGTD